jgi:hypothetical protein
MNNVTIIRLDVKTAVEVEDALRLIEKMSCFLEDKNQLRMIYRRTKGVLSVTKYRLKKMEVE